MPPFDTPRRPVMSPVERLTAVEDSWPEEFECRMPVLNAEMVGAWETVRLVIVVVARVEAPVTASVLWRVAGPLSVRFVAEIVANVETPATFNVPEMI
jgi:hypothetical protein